MSEHSDRLGYEDDLSVGWEAGAASGDEALQRINSDAVRAMKALAAMEETPRDSVDDSSAMQQEIHRIEGKVDLMLSMLSSLTRDSKLLPRRRRVFVHAHGIEWCEKPEDLQVTKGDEGMLSLYLYPRLPVAVRLPAIIASSEQGMPAVQFSALIPELRNALERHVFRHHRRAVARARDERLQEN